MSKSRHLGPLLVLVAAACQSSNSGGGQAEDAGDAGGVDARVSSDGSPGRSPTACTASSDCFPYPAGPAVACCIQSACVYGNAAEAETCADAASQNILASSYDQTCQLDSDCVAIEEGNFCTPDANNGCTNATISKSALSQYQADLAKTQAGVCYSVAGCPAEIAPCCQSGTCAMGGPCTTGDAGSNDAGDTGAE
jgi:hypothetical protein